MKKILLLLSILVGTFMYVGCDLEEVSVSEEENEEVQIATSETDLAQRLDDIREKGDKAEAKVGFEILEIKSPTEIITWMGLDPDMTIEKFEAIQLPNGWFKNQPREGEADAGEFARSPSAAEAGEFTIKELFGYQWRHVATITEANIQVDPSGLLSGNKISKYHQLSFDGGRNLSMIISPEGGRYILVSRDAGRTSDVPNLPESWGQKDTLIQENWTFKLPNPTLNIRTDNEDSFQGPIPN